MQLMENLQINYCPFVIIMIFFYGNLANTPLPLLTIENNLFCDILFQKIGFASSNILKMGKRGLQAVWLDLERQFTLQVSVLLLWLKHSITVHFYKCGCSTPILDHFFFAMFQLYLYIYTHTRIYIIVFSMVHDKPN